MAVMAKKKPKAKDSWGDKMREARKDLGMSQEKAAEHLGIPVGTLRGWEQGRHEPAGYARQLMLERLKQYRR